jgi:hypothetical protein
MALPRTIMTALITLALVTAPLVGFAQEAETETETSEEGEAPAEEAEVPLETETPPEPETAEDPDSADVEVNVGSDVNVNVDVRLDIQTEPVLAPEPIPEPEPAKPLIIRYEATVGLGLTGCIGVETSVCDESIQGTTVDISPSAYGYASGVMRFPDYYVGVSLDFHVGGLTGDAGIVLPDAAGTTIHLLATVRGFYEVMPKVEVSAGFGLGLGSSTVTATRTWTEAGTTLTSGGSFSDIMLALKGTVSGSYRILDWLKIGWSVDAIGHVAGQRCITIYDLTTETETCVDLQVPIPMTFQTGAFATAVF